CRRAESRARLVLSQSCSWLVRVVSRKVAIILLMLSASSASSPEAFTVICGVRSPGHGGDHRGDRAHLGCEGAREDVEVLGGPLPLWGSRCEVPDTPIASA